MAKITYGVSINDDVDVMQYYNFPVLDDGQDGPKKVVYVDQVSGAEIIFKGTGLGVDKNDLLDSGKIKEIDFVDADGKQLATIKSRPGHEIFPGDAVHHANNHASITGAGIHDAFTNNGDVIGEFMYIFQNNDQINGSKGGDYIVGWGGDDEIDGKGGNDFLAGWAGKDTLTGGTGDDIFMFDHGYGKDVVKDFDANGDKDQIWAISDDYTIEKHGNNTVIDYGHGDTLTLLHVKHISDADFYNP